MERSSQPLERSVPISGSHKTWNGSRYVVRHKCDDERYASSYRCKPLNLSSDYESTDETRGEAQCRKPRQKLAFMVIVR